jgi:hypothetical protein
MPLWDEMGRHFASLMDPYPYTTPIDSISAFEDQFKRTALVEELRRLLHVGIARPGRTHLAFARLPFDIVCTTNADFLLEDAYRDAGQEFHSVIGEERLAVAPQAHAVSLLKFHGDLDHPAELVVTEHDYDTFLRERPLLATFLSNLLITRTALLIGYSLDDPDFRQLHTLITDRLGRLRRPAYVLSFRPSEHDVARFARRDVRCINLG